MALFTKVNALRLLGVIVLLLFYNFINLKSSEHAVPAVSKLSLRAHKYAQVQNRTKSHLPAAPLALSNKHYERNSTVIANNFTSIPQDLIQHPSTEFSNTQPKINNITTMTSIIHKTKPHISSNLKLPKCHYPNPRDGGPIKPNKTFVSLDDVEADLGPLLRLGGTFQPKDCLPKDHVAIIVPFRDRYVHLSVFLRNIHPFLMKQNIAYRIFVVEQTNGKSFNRAALLNIGYLEALKIYQWDCFIFHDVDLLPLDDRNLYNCPRQPRHMSVAIDTLKFKLPYRSIFGGVSAMTRQQFQAVNGFSNSYFGWGGEDDDMSNRLKRANLFISRYPYNIARYTMLEHLKEKANPKRYEYLISGMARMQSEGLNSIKYSIYSTKDFPTFTWYMAELKYSEPKG